MAVDRKALWVRLIVTPILLITMAGIVLLDLRHCEGFVSSGVLGLLALAAVSEYVRMMRGAGFPIGRRFLLIAALALHSAAFLSLDVERWQAVDTELFPPVLMTIALVFALSLRALARSRMGIGLEEIGSTLLGFVLLCWPLYFAQGLAQRDPAALFFVVLVAKSGDIGGYLAGIALGSRKLIPHVSPGKSIEGAAGSLVLACLVAWLLHDQLLEGEILGALGAVFVGLLVNLTSQIGDLVESVLKRRCGVKDSSRMLPVHGGVLDLLDSLLFSIPAFFFVLVRLT
ncbi:MAG: phosphatidate cytidylyltransferase [Planctomycetota bacterium]